jgi:hypothetical protein
MVPSGFFHRFRSLPPFPEMGVLGLADLASGKPGNDFGGGL